jgi:hypothetical protein
MSFALLVITGVPGTAPDRGIYTSRVESLREQVPVNAPYGRRFLERDIVPQAPGERLLDQEVFVEVSEDLCDGRARDVPRDAESFDLS